MPTKPEYYCYQSALSDLYLTVTGQQVLKLEYEPEHIQNFNELLPDGEIKNWLDIYFSGKQPQHKLAIHMQGTEFQQKVWNVMLKIPYGETLTYGEVSNAIGSAPRAVGQACKRNHIPVLIPCHRIVGSQNIGGYEGSISAHRVNRKQWLLDHENNSQ